MPQRVPSLCWPRLQPGVPILLPVLLVTTLCCVAPPWALYGAMRYSTLNLPAVKNQGPGLPVLIHLNWGSLYFGRAAWSPDGRWIAGWAGDDGAGSHLEVVTPDGSQQYDLSGWKCGTITLGSDFSIAWLPDNRLSCITGEGYGGKHRLCVGGPPFASCKPLPLPRGFDLPCNFTCGAVWAPDGYALVVAAEMLQDADEPGSGVPTLLVVEPTGTISQVLNVSPDGAYLPAWVPNAPVPQLSYLTGSYVSSPTDPSFTGPGDTSQLIASTVTWDTPWHFSLGPPRVLASGFSDDTDGYAWSPSGRWVAVRQWDSRSGDKIVLVSTDQPAMTVAIVLADKAGGAMMDPIWSPDGKTLIVFTVEYAFSQPYAIDIASYLASKGLAP